MKSKSVLLIIPHLAIGGTEAQTLALGTALVEAGYRVSLLCLLRNLDKVVEQFEKGGIYVIRYSPQYSRYGIRIQYPKGFKLFPFLRKALKKALVLSKPDIIHVQYMTPASTIILLLKYYFRKKNIIATVHTSADVYSSRNLKLVRFIAKHCLKGFQCITENAEKSFFGSSQLFNSKIKLKKRGNHFTIHNSLPAYISIRETPRQ